MFGRFSLLADRSGGLSVIAALAVPVVLGAAGLAFDLNRGYQQREINQRAADMSALGAAMAYKASSNVAILQPTARDLASMNGAKSATVNAQVISNFPNAGDQSVRVRVTSTVPFVLARILGLSSSYTVVSQSFASLVSLPQYAPPCFLALANTADAFKTTGGATVNAPDCSVAAVGSVSNLGTAINAHDIIAGKGNITNDYGTLSAQTLRYAGSFNNPTWNNNVPSVDKRKNQSTTLVDPWATDASLIAARTQLGTYVNPPTLTNPVTSGGTAVNWDLTYSPVAPYNAWWNSSTATYTIPAGTYYIKKLSVGGGIKVKFADNSKIYINEGFSNGGSSFAFGNSDVYVNGGFNSGSSGVTFGNGALWIGSGTVTFSGNTNTKGNGDVMINAMLTMGGGSSFKMGNGKHSFGGFNLGGGGSASMGDGDFIAVQGVTIAGGSELAVGAGNFTIGKASSGNAIDLSGSARFLMGDGQFSANGNIVTQGGSKLVFGKTANHYINGNMTIAGAALFGAGRYTVNGNFTNGTGGTTWPFTSAQNGVTYGQTLEGVSVSGYDMAGVNVSFILAGTLNLAGGAKTKLVASTTTVSGAQIADMLIDTLTTANTSWTAGSQNSFIGTVHIPNSNLTMSGGNSTMGAGQCFTLIANKIEVSGGAAAGSACALMSSSAGGGSSTSTIRLVR